LDCGDFLFNQFMTYFDLRKSEMVGYSPNAFREMLFKIAILKENGTENDRISAVLSSKNKNKKIEIIENKQSVKYTYEQIMEMYYASIYALAINKEWDIKHEIISSDLPDIIFINKTNAHDRVAIEIYQGYDFINRHSRKVIDIKSEVKKLHRIKGNKNYSINFIKSRLLVVNRKKSVPNGFNVSEYCREVNKYSWNFSNIILCLFGRVNNNFTFFNVYPKNMFNIKTDFILSKDSKFLY